MTKATKVLVLAALMLAAAILGYLPAWGQPAAPSQTSAPPSSEGVTSATVFTVHGKIVSVDRTEKLVVLVGPGDRKVALKVENPYNLEAAKVGESVVVRFYEVVNVRKRKPGEDVPSASLKQGIVTARPGGLPGAVADQQLSLVVSVVAINVANGTLTIRGPEGSEETVKARDPNNLKLVSVGDELVVSVSRAIGISLEKDPEQEAPKTDG